MMLVFISYTHIIGLSIFVKRIFVILVCFYLKWCYTKYLL